MQIFFIMNRFLFAGVFVVGLIGLQCCVNRQEQPVAPAAQQEASGPSWAESANLYEVNVRQYSPEGTFAGFEKHLPRLQAMGVDVLWFMPIFPISKARRKGTLGSYYAVADYTAVNPEFGTLEEFRELVKKIHGMGMRVILDWVPNHTGWDNPWLTEHPDWYTHDETGAIVDPQDEKTGESIGWTDVADLNYDNPELRQAMTKAMEFWLREADVDGFRCDVAWGVPLDYWRECIPALREVKPDVFMLAEAEIPEQRNEDLFTMSYAWSFHQLMNDIAQGNANAKAIDDWLKKDRSAFHRGYHMQFITNHDENSGKGTIQERLGPAADALAVLAFTFDGMPLLYSGQEAGLNKRLRMFDKDTIPWDDYPKQDFYSVLLDLKHRNRALWNGAAGGEPQRILTGKDDKVYAFYRERDGDKAIVVLNLSADLQDVVLQNDACVGEYTDVFANSTVSVTRNTLLTLNPWDFVIWSNK